MIAIQIKVNGPVVSVQNEEPLYSGSADVHRCCFTFDENWDGFSRSAVFRVGDRAVTAVVDDEGVCTLPWELLTRANIGLPIEVGVYGVSASAEVLTSVWDQIGIVRDGTELGNDAREPGAGVYDQVMASVQRIDEKVKDYSDSVVMLTQRAESASKVAQNSAASAKETVSAVTAQANRAEAAQDAAQNAYAGVKKALDNLAEGDTLIVNDLTTGGTSAALSAEMGKVLSQRPNPQLLINADFTNVINQRGQTVYTTNGYTVDCWRSSYVNTRVTLGADGITLASEVDTSRYVQQFIEYPERLYGRTVTLSALVEFGDETEKEIVLVSDTKTIPATPEKTQVCSLSFTPSISSGLHMRADGRLLVQFGIKSGASYKVKAAKLELGGAQTLAHLDEKEGWVLNEVSDYVTELRRCQRYFQVINRNALAYAHLLDVRGVGDRKAVGTLVLPVPMRANPAVTVVGVNPQVTISWNEGDILYISEREVTNVAVSGDSGDSERLRLEVTVDDTDHGFESGGWYEVTAGMTGNIGQNTRIFLDANL